MTMSCRNILLFVGTIVLAVFASTSATASDVPGMTCSAIGSFAQQVAQRKAEGVSVDDAIRRLRQSFGSEHADSEHELEKIVRAITACRFFLPPARKTLALPTRPPVRWVSGHRALFGTSRSTAMASLVAADPLARAGPDWSFAR